MVEMVRHAIVSRMGSRRGIWDRESGRLVRHHLMAMPFVIAAVRLERVGGLASPRDHLRAVGWCVM